MNQKQAHATMKARAGYDYHVSPDFTGWFSAAVRHYDRPLAIEIDRWTSKVPKSKEAAENFDWETFNQVLIKLLRKFIELAEKQGMSLLYERSQLDPQKHGLQFFDVKQKRWISAHH